MSAPEQPQDWFFTFGANHTHPDTGAPLGRAFIRIHDTWLRAREAMLDVFGSRWCDQYSSAEKAGVKEYGLVEVPLPEASPVTDIDESEQPFSPLVGAPITQMNKDRDFTANALIDSYKRQLHQSLAELYAIREGVSDLLHQPWAPSARAIQQAVFAPDRDLLAEGLRLAEEGK